MPQDFQVLRCFQCSIFQVHQVKKSKKWDCKLCGSKQSFKRNYGGVGTSKECRLHVQTLNLVRGETCELEENVNSYDQENKIVNNTNENSDSACLKNDETACAKKEIKRLAGYTLENLSKRKKLENLNHVEFFFQKLSQEVYDTSDTKCTTGSQEVNDTCETISTIEKIDETNLVVRAETTAAEEVGEQSIFSQNDDIDLDEILNF